MDKKMKVENKSFNEWLEKEKKIKYEDKNAGYYEALGETFRLYIQKDWIIGLMTIYLLDKGYYIFKEEEEYSVWQNNNVLIMFGRDLYDCLRNTIESIKE